jgi:hypothetical protein
MECVCSTNSVGGKRCFRGFPDVPAGPYGAGAAFPNRRHLTVVEPVSSAAYCRWVQATERARRTLKFGVAVDTDGVLRVAWLAAEEHLQHNLVSRTDVLGLTGSYLSRNEEAPGYPYPVRPRLEGGVEGRRRREGIAHHSLGEQGRGSTLRLVCTADVLSEEKQEGKDRASRVLDVEKGAAVGMMVVGRRGPRSCGNSEQESEGQGQLCSTHTTAAGIATPGFKAKKERMQSASTRRTREAISAERQSAHDEDQQRVCERDHEPGRCITSQLSGGSSQQSHQDLLAGGLRHYTHCSIELHSWHAARLPALEGPGRATTVQRSPEVCFHAYWFRAATAAPCGMTRGEVSRRREDSRCHEVESKVLCGHL